MKRSNGSRHDEQSGSSRRDFLKRSALAATGLTFFPYISRGELGVSKPLTRSFGRIGFDVTTLGLGGQASLQWTPDGVDPVAIVIKAYKAGVNYFDTSNLYGPSQQNFGKAFRALGLVPGQSNYNEAKRRSVFLTSKTHLRWAKGGDPDVCSPGWTNGPRGTHAIDDVRRSLSQIFGNGEGAYPDGAYLDMVLFHSLNDQKDVDGIYVGIENTSPDMEHIGALAGLRDIRDGTNLTGLNPKHEKLIRHIGFSGHRSPAVMMEMMRRDRDRLIDGMLVSVNANDRLYANMQYNVLPVARALNVGVIAMKVFADGAMYNKEARWSRSPSDVVQTVGSRDLPSRPLVEYTLTTPGVSTLIIGTGHISDAPSRCQLTQNLSAAQVQPNDMNANDRRRVETLTRPIKDGQTNYFQLPNDGLTAPAAPALVKEGQGVRLTWHTALAGDEPISHYEVMQGDQSIGRLPYEAQTSLDPFTFELPTNRLKENTAPFRIVTVDTSGRRASSAGLSA